MSAISAPNTSAQVGKAYESPPRIYHSCIHPNCPRPHHICHKHICEEPIPYNRNLVRSRDVRLTRQVPHDVRVTSRFLVTPSIRHPLSHTNSTREGSQYLCRMTQDLHPGILLQYSRLVNSMLVQKPPPDSNMAEAHKLQHDQRHHLFLLNC